MTELVAFEDERCRDVALAGGKGASLAAMTAAGLPVPPGFVVPSGLLEAAVDAARLRELAVGGDHEGAQALVRAAEVPRAQNGVV
jgi:pyruvate,water dikinase